MKPLVENEITEALAAKGPEGTAAVLDRLVAQPVADTIGDSRRGAPNPRVAVAALHAPAGDGIPLVEMLQHAGNIVGIVLEIGIHDHHPTPPHRLEASVGGCRLAGIGLEPDEPRAKTLLVEAPNAVRAPIAAAVVDEDHLVVEAGRIQHFVDLGPEDGEILFLVIDGNNDGEVNRGKHASSGRSPAPGW